MSYAESDLLPISALQHLLFCERQCALIHLEREWVENRFTAEGALLHRNAHEGKAKTRDGVRITRGLPLRSLALGLSGQADVVLWKPPPGLAMPVARRQMAATLRGELQESLVGWTVTPVEYKRGQPKKNDSDRVQLCAQAICLQEMTGIEIPRGEIFYGKNRRRVEVVFDATLRGVTSDAAIRFHQMMASGITPAAVRDARCDSCSLLPVCLPEVSQGSSASAFFTRQLSQLEQGG